MYFTSINFLVLMLFENNIIFQHSGAHFQLFLLVNVHLTCNSKMLKSFHFTDVCTLHVSTNIRHLVSKNADETAELPTTNFTFGSIPSSMRPCV
jgi:hypothetical protein